MASDPNQGGAVAPHRYLPPPLDDRYAWQLGGVCRQQDPEMFFLESERGQTREVRVAEAKRVCAACPVMLSCREHGLKAQEPYGIWGGLTVRERETQLRVRRRNRFRVAQSSSGPGDAPAGKARP